MPGQCLPWALVIQAVSEQIIRS